MTKENPKKLFRIDPVTGSPTNKSIVVTKKIEDPTPHTTASLSLSKSALPQAENSDHVIDALGLRFDKYASRSDVAEIIRSHNSANGRHLLDIPKHALCSFSRAYGSSLGWILGDFSFAGAKQVIAKNAGHALRSFFNGSLNSGVRVVKRMPDEHGVLLVPIEICGNPKYLLDEDYTLLVPTGVTSPRIGNRELFERLDLCKSHDPAVDFAVRRILFTAEDGESIVGLWDVSNFYVENLKDLQRTIKNELGCEYDLIDVNKRIFSAVERHFDFASHESEIIVPLSADVTLVFVRRKSSTWKIEFDIGEESFSIEEIAPDGRFVFNSIATLSAYRRLISAYNAITDLRGAIDEETIFSVEHLSRFPEEFQHEIQKDFVAAKKKFVAKLNESLKSFQANHRFWKPISFSGGLEKDLIFGGDSTEAAIQLCAPVYLTESAEALKIASVYAVAELRSNSQMGNDYCFIPSILDHQMAIADINNMHQGIRH